ncbi:vitamin B12-dependent ribonucleotide reductase [Acetobacteraceae bacterium]|nr:vitamin B12-dependent ribonucleotide reductase [Acetobacteraceae bacterium]
MADKKSSFTSIWQRNRNENCWAGVQMRTLEVEDFFDEEREPRKVVFPAVWPDISSYALEQLASASVGTVRLQSEATWWLNLMAPSSEDLSQNALGDGFIGLLLLRQMAPSVSLWKKDLSTPPAFVIRLSAFVEEGIFQASHFLACLEMAAKGLKKVVEARSNLSMPLLPIFEEGSLGLFEEERTEKEDEKLHSEAFEASFLLSDLDSALAAMGLEYDSTAGRSAAQGIVVLAKLASYMGEEAFHLLEGADSLIPLDAPSEMRHAAYEFCTKILCSLQRLGATKKFLDQEKKSSFFLKVGFSAPNPVDSLLGVEACGLAPIFSPLDEAGQVRNSFTSRLMRQGLTAENALALVVAGEKRFSMPGNQAHLKMREVVKEVGCCLPPLPNFDVCEVKAKLERGTRHLAPARKKSVSERVLLDNRDLFFRIGEFEDGTPAELEIHMVKESPLAKGLMECFGQAVSLGLQYGVPLEAYVEQFKYSQFVPFGEVEGGRNIQYATSMMDYIFRSLAELYLGKEIPDHKAIDGTASFSRKRSASAPESLKLPFKESRTGTEG